MKGKNTLGVVVGSCAITILLPSLVAAGLVNFYIAANGEQEVGGVISAGTGAGWVQLDPQTNDIEWSFIYSDLTGAGMAAHFHGPAIPGQNAAAQIALSLATNPIVGSQIITDAQKMDLLNNLWYLNIHTAAYPAGEIRGQVIKVIPEPATLALLGLGGLSLLRRRRFS